MDPVIVISELQLTCYSFKFPFSCTPLYTLAQTILLFGLFFSAFSPCRSPLTFSRLHSCSVYRNLLTLNQLSTTGYADVCRCSRDL